MVTLTFLFLHGNTLLGQSWSRKSNYQFNLKFHRYLLLRLKFRRPKGPSLHKSFMGNCPKIGHMFYPFVTNIRVLLFVSGFTGQNENAG